MMILRIRREGVRCLGNGQRGKEEEWAMEGIFFKNISSVQLRDGCCAHFAAAVAD